LFGENRKLPMKAKTEEFLYLLLWGFEKMTRPTYCNLTESVESWRYRNGLERQIGRLERHGLIESKNSPGKRRRSEDRLVRLTQAGRLHALGGCDPEAEWRRSWDGKWRLVMFDVPNAHRATRARLRQHLRGRRFGCLQKSVWISPHPTEEERTLLLPTPADVQSLLFWEGRPCAGESDREIVAAAWNFPQLERAYARHRRVLDALPRSVPLTDAGARELLRWGSTERKSWQAAVTKDPLLPEPLLPADYLGKAAWRSRLETLRRAGGQLQCFRLGVRRA
jgi:phenylacetic acid degradation operon negative regulatory protein